MSTRAQTAAKWWRDVLERSGNPARGASLEPMGTALIGAISAKHKRITKEQADGFEERLLAILEAKAHFPRLMMRVDYHPCRILSEAIGDIPYRMGLLPFKFDMLFRDDMIEVRKGYHDDWHEIWRADR